MNPHRERIEAGTAKTAQTSLVHESRAREGLAQCTQEAVMRDRSAFALCIIIGVVGMLACINAGDHLAFWGMVP